MRVDGRLCWYAINPNGRVVMKKLLLIPVAAAALTLGLSGCGGDSTDDAGGKVSPSSSSGGATSAPTGGGTITGNGGGNGGGGSNGGGTGKGNLTPAQQESVSKLVACMRKKGYDMPEPTSPAVAPKNTNGKSTEQVNKDAAECATQSQPTGG